VADGTTSNASALLIDAWAALGVNGAVSACALVEPPVCGGDDCIGLLVGDVAGDEPQRCLSDYCLGGHSRDVPSRRTCYSFAPGARFVDYSCARRKRTPSNRWPQGCVTSRLQVSEGRSCVGLPCAGARLPPGACSPAGRRPDGAPRCKQKPAHAPARSRQSPG